MSFHNIRQTKTFRLIYKLLELLFLALVGIYLFYRVSRITTFGLVYPAGFEGNLLIVMTLVAVLRLFSTPLRRWKTLAALGFALVYCLVYRSDGYRFLLFLAVMTVGLIDIDYRKILKVYVASVGIITSCAVFAGVIGAITNLVYTGVGRGLRSAWGIAYPTDFATLIFFILLALWILAEKCPAWVMLFPCAVFVMIARFIAYSINSTVCGAVFMLAILYCTFERQIISRRPGLGWVKKGVNRFATIAFPLFALTMFALMAAYARGIDFAYRLDDLFSGRIRMAVEAWQEHGLNAFGTPFKLISFGQSTIIPTGYNFVDSSYPLILLRYGWVLLLMLCVTWGGMAKQAIKLQNRRLILVLILIAMHSFMEHHFIDCFDNILLVTPLASFSLEQCPNRVASGVKREARPFKKNGIAYAITAIICVSVLWFVTPRAFSAIRTVLDYNGLHGGADNGWVLLGIILGLLTLMAAIIWAMNGILRGFVNRVWDHRFVVRACTLAGCFLMVLGICIYSDHQIEAAAEENASMVEADRKALEIAIGAATGKVYTDVLPAVYHRRIDGLSYSHFSQDDLARHFNCTCLLSSDTERDVFLHSGCLYIQVSDANALYTDDQAVVEALTEAGYHATGYYSAVREVDLADAAEKNKLKYNASNGMLMVNKVKRPMKKGPYYNLYEGWYTATYDVYLPKSVPMDEETVCILYITAEKGKKVVLEKEIKGDQFDTKRSLSVSIPFFIGSTRDVAFCARVENGKKVCIRGIKFARTPESDVHTFYDSQLRVVRQSYYDPNGMPMIQSAGYTSYKQDYDEYDNVISQRFYDEKGNLMLRTDGYAEVRWMYDAKKQRIREAYYDTNGNPVIVKGGYASKSWRYDKAGNVISESYFDSTGQPTERTNGYACIEREYDENHNVVLQRFLDSAGHLVVTGSGYAEVRRSYSDNHIVHEAYYDVDGDYLVRPGGYVAIAQTWNEDNLYSRTYLDRTSQPINRTDGYSKVIWESGETCENVKFYDVNNNEVSIAGINLARDISYGPDGWSDWQIPTYKAVNSCQNIGFVNLGEKHEGDVYTCQIEIEFKGVSASEGQAFGFWTQGAQDGKWITGNVWDGSLINLNGVPENGIYRFTSTKAISGDMTNISTFNIGFRCDYWRSGMYRVRKVKIEKGTMSSEWSPGL